jgi:hypothetical protein
VRALSSSSSGVCGPQILARQGGCCDDDGLNFKNGRMKHFVESSWFLLHILWWG